MLFIFDVNLCFYKCCDVIFVPGITHKLAEPLPHWEAVELAEQRCVMKAYPTTFALLNIVFECFYSFFFPPVRGVIQLEEQLIVRKKSLVNLISILNIIDTKVLGGSQAIQPYFGPFGVVD